MTLPDENPSYSSAPNLADLKDLGMQPVVYPEQVKPWKYMKKSEKKQAAKDLPSLLNSINTAVEKGTKIIVAKHDAISQVSPLDWRKDPDEWWAFFTEIHILVTSAYHKLKYCKDPLINIKAKINQLKHEAIVKIMKEVDPDMREIDLMLHIKSFHQLTKPAELKKMFETILKPLINDIESLIIVVIKSAL